MDQDPRSPADTISFTDNYFADTSLSGVYTHAVDTGATIRFERNVFLGFHFNYGLLRRICGRMSRARAERLGGICGAPCRIA